MMKRIEQPIPGFLLALCLMASLFVSCDLFSQQYAVGADLSFLKMAEERGFVMKEDGKPVDGLELFREHGYSWIRLRLFKDPDELPNDLEYTIDLARKAKGLGYQFLLDYHYSDTWADPAKQFIPAAWERMSHQDLVTAVFNYTRETIVAFRDAGVMPDMVQIGNEVINGMLWPDGKLPENWKNFTELVNAGIQGIYAACDEGARPRIMIHIDQGGNIERTAWFFDNFIAAGIEFDVIGQSYYPWWHGSLLDLRNNLAFMAERYHKPIILVEVAYCSEPTEYTGKPAPFEESPQGQKEFLEEVNRIVMNTPDGLGAGIFWWEPAVYGNRGIGTRDFFDDDGNVLPVIQVFDKYSRH